MKNSKKITLSEFKAKSGMASTSASYLEKISGGILGACHVKTQDKMIHGGETYYVETECN